LFTSAQLAKPDDENGLLRHGQKPQSSCIVFCPWHKLNIQLDTAIFSGVAQASPLGLIKVSPVKAGI
jgi:hypothetical protein